jgi:hypothetical protein
MPISKGKKSELMPPDTQSPGEKAKKRKSSQLSWPLPRTSPQPETPPAAEAYWAYLLLALGSRPGMAVVDWRPSSDCFVNTQNGGIDMEVDGSVMSHIINLYGLLPDSRPFGRSDSEQIPRYANQKFCNFSFGRLGWEKTKDQIHAHSEPGVEKELYSDQLPFATL